MALRDANVPTPTKPNTPLKVCCDASFEWANNMAYGGWQFTDHCGQTTDVVGAAIGKTSGSLQAEVLAIEKVLDMLSKNPEVQHVKVYTDCDGAAERATDGTLSSGFQSVSVEWIPREENVAADFAANQAIIHQKGSPNHRTPFGTTD